MSGSRWEGSWRVLEAEDPRYALSPEIREASGVGGVDCGWVEQITPFIQEFSEVGDRVLDPFCGYGTTLVACALEGRRGVGVELEADRVAWARQRVEAMGGRPEVLYGDARAQQVAPASCDLCVTSVPYFGFRGFQEAKGTRLAGQMYGTRRYAQYLEWMGEVWVQVGEALKDGALAVVMAENVRDAKGRLVPLAWDVARGLGPHLELLEDRVLCYPRREAEGLAGRPTHEVALVARRPRAFSLGAVWPLLRALVQCGVDYALIGTAGVALGDPELLEGPPGDCDLLLGPEPEQWLRFVKVAHQYGFAVYSWNVPLDPGADAESLRGRVYLRAVRGSGSLRQVVEATYECAPLSFAEAAQELRWVRGLPVASCAHIARLLRARGKPRDLRRAQAIDPSDVNG